MADRSDRPPDLLGDSIVPERAREIKREARQVAEESVLPHAEKYYRTGEYPSDILEAGQEAGLVAQDIGEEYGGRGFDLAQQLALYEELFRADAGIGMTLQLASFGANILEKYGTEAQKEQYLRPVAAGEQTTGLGVSEPDTGSDLAGMKTTAERDGDEWVLNGEKFWIGNGVEGDWLSIYARTGDDERDPHGNFSLFIVPTETPGYEAEHIPEKMGMRASKQAHIVLDDCRVPETHLIGEEGDGFGMVADFFNHGRVIVAGHGIGLAAAAIEETWEFVHGREEFGHTINEFQAVQHGLADVRTEFESARALTWRAVEEIETGENPGLWAAMAKTKATETAADCAERGMQYHGGRSMLSDRRIARVYRDVRAPVIYEGASEIQRDLIYRHF
jgi:alkylation response protein AidB-like acyl-CoA dehydrogenase